MKPNQDQENSVQVAYWGFPVSQDLYTRLHAIISEITGGSASGKQQNKALSEATYDLVKEGLHAYYHAPTHLMPMNPSKQKTIDNGVKVITGALKLVISKFFGSLDQSRLQAVASYIDSMLHAPQSDEPARLLFALEGGLEQKLSGSLREARNPDAGEQESQDIIEALQQVVEVSIQHYYQNPVDLVQLGRITRSVTDLAIRNVKKAFDSFLEKMISKLDQENLAKLSEYMETLLREPSEEPKKAVG